MNLNVHFDKVRSGREAGWQVPLTAFFFPVLVCCTGFAILGVYPFGTRSALIIDGVHQYLGFYEEFFQQLQTGQRWLFSGHAMGYSFYSLFSYYLSSPFSLLVLLLMRFLYVNEAVTVVVLLKIGLTGACMAWYAQKKLPGKGSAAVCAGSMYALSNYVLGYYSNLMWLDCVMLTPVLAWTIEKLAESGRWRNYSLVLGYCIFSNYYLGFVLCVFSVLYYLAVRFGAEERAENWWKSGLKFTGASVLGGGMAAVILIPTVYAVAQTIAAKEAGLPAGTGVYGNIWEQLGRLMLDSWPYATSADQSAVNLYCGCAAILFLALYLLNRGICWRQKAALGELLLFYFAGFHFSALNLLLHGLHKPIGMPNRFAFLFIFLLLKAATEGWGRGETLDRKAAAAGAAASVLFCSAVGVNTGNMRTIIGTAGMIAMYYSLFMEISSFPMGKPGRKRMEFLLAALVFWEIGLHGIIGICHDGSANRNFYETSGKELKQIMSEKDDGQEYRADIVNPVLRNEELLYRMNGVSMFSSTNTDRMLNWMEKMGFETGPNRFQYAGGTEAADMLLGIRYLACRKNLQLRTSYRKTDSGDYFDLYENPRALADGCLTDNRMKNFRLEGKNPIEIQNHLFSAMGCGILYRTETVQALRGQPGTDTVFETDLKGGEHGYLWIGGVEPEEVKIDGRLQKKGDWNNNFLDLGYSDTDRTVRIQISGSRTEALLGICGRAQLDRIYRKLSANELRLKNGSGSLHASKDGVLFLRSFYDAGIQVRVDGKKAETLNLDGMLGVPVSKGQHTVEIRYEVPGLRWGAAISVLCLLWWLAAGLPARRPIRQWSEENVTEHRGEEHENLHL